MPDHPVERTPDEARAGTTPGILRWMLLISLTFTVVGMGFLLAFGMQGQHSQSPTENSAAQ